MFSQVYRSLSFNTDWPVAGSECTPGLSVHLLQFIISPMLKHTLFLSKLAIMNKKAVTAGFCVQFSPRLGKYLRECYMYV